MTQANQIVTTSAEPTGGAICSQPNCKEPAVAAYLWDWGEHGTCCANHQITLNQTAGNIKRRIQFTVLAPGAPVAMGRDERTKLKAAALVLEEELEEAKQRGLELYQANATLAGQVQLLTVQKRELEAQNKDAKAAEAAAVQERDKLKIQLADSNDELQRLQTIAKASKSK